MTNVEFKNNDFREVRKTRDELIEMINKVSPYWLACVYETITYFENEGIPHEEDDIFKIALKCYEDECITDMFNEIYGEVVLIAERYLSEKTSPKTNLKSIIKNIYGDDFND